MSIPGLIRNAAALLALAAGVRAEVVPLETVKWQPDFGAPSPGLLVGRSKIVYLFDARNADARKGYENLGWILISHTGETRFASIVIAIDGDYPPYHSPPAYHWSRGLDDGSLLRAFAGDGPAALLVFDATGRLTDLRKVSEIDNPWLTVTLPTMMEKGKPLFDDGAIPGSLHDSMHWFVTGDLKRFSADAAKAKGGPDTLRAMAKSAGALADTTAAIVADGTAKPSDRLLALHRLQALAGDFPSTAAAYQKAQKAAKADAAMKPELEGWDAFEAYLKAVLKAKGPAAAETQKKQLPAIVEKHPGTYAAEVATKIGVMVGVIAAPAKPDAEKDKAKTP